LTVICLALIAGLPLSAHAMGSARELADDCRSLLQAKPGTGEQIRIPFTKKALVCWGYMQAMQDLSVLADEDGRRIMGACPSQRTTALLGKDAPNLSPAVISRLTAEWQGDLEASKQNNRPPPSESISSLDLPGGSLKLFFCAAATCASLPVSELRDRRYWASLSASRSATSAYRRTGRSAADRLALSPYPASGRDRRGPR
jgi:hypothetical protein